MKGSAKWKDSRALHRRSLCLCAESLVAKAQRKNQRPQRSRRENLNHDTSQKAEFDYYGANNLPEA